MKAFVCRCNNCMMLFKDETMRLENEKINVPKDLVLGNLKLITNEYGETWACPFCETDDYLTDVTEEIE